MQILSEAMAETITIKIRKPTLKLGMSMKNLKFLNNMECNMSSESSAEALCENVILRITSV